MKTIKAAFVFNVCFLITLQATGQLKPKAERIDVYCDSVINNIDAYKGVLLNKQPLGTFGGFLDGFLLHDSVVLITHVIAHASVYQEQYFFENGRLVLVKEWKVHGKQVFFTNKYYFSDEKIFHYSMSAGKKIKRKRLSKELLANAQQYKSIFYSQQGEN